MRHYLLKNTKPYRLFSRVVSRKDSLQVIVDRYIRPKSGDQVLDIGCGDASVLARLPQVKYIGIDHNKKYIESARRRFAARGIFLVADVTEVDELVTDLFDVVLMLGVLHHLSDKQAERTLHLACRRLKPRGRIVTWDGVYTENQSWIAKCLLRRDRGEFVRDESGYLRLVPNDLQVIEKRIEVDLLRIPYSHLVVVLQSKS
jgi:SAM-dependent methyltransferase